MRIGIDARLINETGVGRYIRNLISELAVIPSHHTFVVFLPPQTYETFVLPNSKWEKRCVDIHWHTLKEQIRMPGIFLREHLDMVHIPYFNVPIFYPKSYVVTIHDLTILHIHTGKATTLPLPLYWLRRLGYMLIIRIGIRHARHVIAVSESTKKDIIRYVGIDPEKISVTYEGVDGNIMAHATQKKGTDPIKNPYFLYVGNAYPHKNLETLIRAFGLLIEKEKDTQQQLVLVGKDDFFYARLKTWVTTLPYADHIRFFGAADDTALLDLYTHATAFVFPSLMEGFGLPALEAIACMCPVICSDIPVFRELFTMIPTYVNPRDMYELCDAMHEAMHGDGKKIIKKERDLLLSRFGWDSMAKKTMAIYESGTRV